MQLTWKDIKNFNLDYDLKKIQLKMDYYKDYLDSITIENLGDKADTQIYIDSVDQRICIGIHYFYEETPCLDEVIEEFNSMCMSTFSSGIDRVKFVYYFFEKQIYTQKIDIESAKEAYNDFLGESKLVKHIFENREISQDYFDLLLKFFKIIKITF